MEARRKINPVKNLFLQFGDDVLVIAGCGLIIYGVSLIYFPAAWITGGVLSFGLAVLYGLGNRRSGK